MESWINNKNTTTKNKNSNNSNNNDNTDDDDDNDGDEYTNNNDTNYDCLFYIFTSESVSLEECNYFSFIAVDSVSATNESKT